MEGFLERFLDEYGWIIVLVIAALVFVATCGVIHRNYFMNPIDEQVNNITQFSQQLDVENNWAFEKANVNAETSEIEISVTYTLDNCEVCDKYNADGVLMLRTIEDTRPMANALSRWVTVVMITALVGLLSIPGIEAALRIIRRIKSYKSYKEFQRNQAKQNEQ